jgi:two-component system invasion response regulator UvrY
VTIRVLLVDDHELVRTGIRRLLEDFDDIEIIAEAENGEEAINLVRQDKPDVILMDVNMPGIGGLEATRKLLQIHDDMKIIVVTMHVEEPFPTRLLKAGATGYLTKGCAVTEIVDAIRTVHKGKRFIGSDVAQQLALGMLPGNDKSPFDALSQRELQVMLMVTQGQKIQDIAEMLCLSPKTVSTYRYRLFDKLDVKSDVELTHLAMRHGMIDDSGASST